MPWRLCVRFIRDFRGDKRGVIAMIFALVFVPLALIIALAIDYGRASTFQTAVQKVLDEAVLDGARELARSSDPSKAKKVAAQRLAGTKPTGHEVQAEFLVDSVNHTIKAEAMAEVPATLAGIIGFKTFRVGARATATYKPQKRASKGRRSPRQQASLNALSKLSDRQLRDLIYRVNRMCHQIMQMGMADRVPQCRAVFDGSFETRLRATVASNGDTSDLLPSGIRLTQ